jgi:Leucine-rich repeat (LRR) protein
MRLRARWHLHTILIGIAVLAVFMAMIIEPRRRRAEQECAIAALERLDALIGARPFYCVINSARRPVLSICLTNPDITDADLAPLASLTELETLALSSTKITNAGLAHLEGLTSLTELDLVETNVTDAGLFRLRGMVKLRSLNLAATKIRGRGLVDLGRLANLRSLSLLHTRVTGPDLVYLKALTHLEVLDLSGAITDSDLKNLTSLTRLKSLLLADTHVTEAGSNELQRALPVLQVQRE